MIKDGLTKGMIGMLVVMVSLPWSVPLHAQAAPASAPATFRVEEIEQMVAPIALYPDTLVSQILMASTYPLEVVEADRWAKKNNNLKGDPFAAELEKQSWDPSVKSLVNFPQVLAMMSEKIDLTQKLGDMFLAQQKDVLDAIQRLRAKAQAAGNLKTTEQQKVIVEQPTATQQTTVIKIEPAQPEVIYVPQYNPTVVYGAWAYPSYPPYPWYPPGYAASALVGGALAFGAGVALGSAWGYGWGDCDWHGGKVKVNVDRNVNINNTHINRNNYRQNYQGGNRGGSDWQHNANHRKGVSYRDNNTAQKYNRGTDAKAAQSREAFRGRAESGRQDLARSGSDRGGVGDRASGAGAGDRGGSGGLSKAGDRGGAGDRGSGSGAANRGTGVSDRSGGGADRVSAGDRGGSRGSGGGRESGAFQGVGGGGGDARAASARGSASRSGSASRGGGGGGGRSGGGGGGGRGGGGGGGRR
jgi:hypothetical protein